MILPFFWAAVTPYIVLVIVDKTGTMAPRYTFV